MYKRQIKATEPRFLYKALVSYEDRSLAKKAGFLWNNLEQGAWAKKLTVEEANSLDFKVQILDKYFSSLKLEKPLVHFTGHPFFTHFMRTDTSIF